MSGLRLLGAVPLALMLGCGVAAEPTLTAPSTSVTETTTISVATTDRPDATTITTLAPTSTTTTEPALDIEGTPMIEFSIVVDDALDLEYGEFAAFVVETLRDSRSWSGRGVGFRLLDEGGLFTLTVATPDRVDALCAPLRPTAVSPALVTAGSRSTPSAGSVQPRSGRATSRRTVATSSTTKSATTSKAPTMPRAPPPARSHP